MKGLFRALSTGVLAIAIAGAGFPSVLIAHAANTPPVITSIRITPDTANEGDIVLVEVTFIDPDPDVESVSILWSDQFTGAPISYVGGSEISFVQQRKVVDDFPSASSVDRLDVTVTIDDGLSQARATASVTMHNVPPEFTAFTVAPAAILPGESVTAAGSFSDVGLADSFTLELNWGDGSANTVKTFKSTVAKEFALPHVYALGGSHTVTAKLWDDDMTVVDAVVARATVVVTSPNTPPSDLRVTPGAAVEGGATTFAMDFVDPDAADTHTASVVWGDGSPLESIDGAAGVTSLTATHTYRDSGTYNATVTVADSGTITASLTLAVPVANVGPTVMTETLSASSIVEMESVTVDATFVDPGMSDTFTLTMDWGDGTSWSTPLGTGAHAASAAHQYLAAGAFVIIVTVKDSDNALGSMTKTLDVRARNRGPVELKLTPPSSPRAGSPAALTGVFTDPDTSDTHTVSVGWGDTKTGAQSLGAGVDRFTATHTYATSGPFHVTVTVTDPAGLWTSQTVDLVVQKKRDQDECDQLVALEQRYAWLNDHDTHGLLARAAAYLSSRFGCDDDEDGDHRASGSAIRTQVTVNMTVKQSDTRRSETGQSDDREGRRTER